MYSRLKTHLSHHANHDPFAPYNVTRSLAQELSVREKYLPFSFTIQDGKGADFSTHGIGLQNIGDSLTRRVQSLYDSGKLLQGEQFGNKLWVSIIGDKGGSYTKLCLLIGNVTNTNSRANLLLVGVYKGSDSNQFMNNCFKSQIDELNSLRFVTILTGSGSENVEIEWFLTGDMMFLYECYGHQGPSSTHNCLICDFRRTTKGIPSQQWTKRAIVNGKLSGDSVRNEQYALFPKIDLTNIIPPSLHIIMGIANFFIDALEAKAIAEDAHLVAKNVDIQKRSQLKSMLSSVKNDHALAKERHRSVTQQLKRSRQVLVLFDAVKRAETIFPETGTQLCHHRDTCLFRDFRANGIDTEDRWINCDMCKAAYHVICVPILTIEAEARYDTTFFACGDCSGMSFDDRLKSAQDQANTLNTDMKATENEASQLTERVNEFSNALGDAGPKMKELEGMFSKCGADKRAFFQKFTGNHVRKLLQHENAKKLWSLFPNDYESKSYLRFTKALAKVQGFSKSSFLTQEEIIDLNVSLVEMLSELQNANKDMSMTPKLHMLVEHVPEFVAKHKTWGLISEQPIEALHAYYNQQERRFCAIRDPALRLKMIANEVSFQNYLFDKY